MKATGVVRRIDNLGRIVIPKEIRRTMHIRENDPMEIFTNPGGEVILKKYSPVGEMSDLAACFAEAIAQKTSFSVLVLDREHCIAAAGPGKNQMLERHASEALENLMEQRKSYIKAAAAEPVPALENTAAEIMVATPILSAGDVSGAVLLADAGGGVPNEADIKLTQVAADFLGRNIEP